MGSYIANLYSYYNYKIVIIAVMKTIANIIIINSHNVESEHLLAVIMTSVFKEESSVSPG